MSFEAIPGFVELKEAHGETTVVVEREQILAACLYARDELGFTFLADLVATDYLGWDAHTVS